MTTHALTIDLEDWSQLVRRRITGELQDPSEDVGDATRRLLDVLDAAETRATFFTVGMLAEARPDLVREVARRGHEIGSHSFAHQLIFTLDRATFRADLDRSRKFLQDLTGQPVLGFRAPEFSVHSLGHWCFEVLREAGFEYDSSVFPLPRARYGIAGAPQKPFVHDTPAGRLWEFPLATWDVGGARLPIAGGTYYRLLPGSLIRRAVTDLDAGGRSAVLYFHPYEFSAATHWLPDLAARSWLDHRYLRMVVLHNMFTARIVRRIQPLLTEFAFAPLAELYRANSDNHEKGHAHA